MSSRYVSLMEPYFKGVAPYMTGILGAGITAHLRYAWPDREAASPGHTYAEVQRMRRRATRKSSLYGFLLKAAVALVALSVTVGFLLDLLHTHPLAFAGVCLIVAGLVCLRLFLKHQYSNRRRLRFATLGELLMLSPRQFEAAVADLLHDLGYRDIRLVGGSGDLGADIWCRDVQGRSTVVQCKRYAPGARIGSPDIQTFIGMMAIHHQAESGMFVTTSAFTQPAADLALRHRIMLIDGAMLSRLVVESRQDMRRLREQESPPPKNA